MLRVMLENHMVRVGHTIGQFQYRILLSMIVLRHSRNFAKLYYSASEKYIVKVCCVDC